jgi:hypothetical protein
MQGVGVPASNSMSCLRSHSSDKVAEAVVTAASATVSNVVGVTDTEACRSMRNGVMNLQQYCLLPSLHPNLRHPVQAVPLT